MPRSESGFTLLEITLVGAIVAVLVIACAAFIRPMTRFFQRTHARQQANLDLRVTLETMQRILSNGVAGTCKISTVTGPSNPSHMPYNQLSLSTIDQTSYVFYWSNQPVNSIHFKWMSPPPAPQVYNDKVLASNIASLQFAFDDPNDPGIIHVSFQMQVPLDTSGSPDSIMIVTPPPLTVRLATS